MEKGKLRNGKLKQKCLIQVKMRLKGALSQVFSCFQLHLLLKSLPGTFSHSQNAQIKWTNRNISNEWWLREYTIMNFWQYFQGMALEFEKTG